MPSLSAEFTVDGSSAQEIHATTYGGTVNLALLSTTGVRTIQWSISSTSHEVLVAPTITPAGSPTGATASFAMVVDPGDGEGRSVIVQCLVTNSAGQTATSTRKVSVANTRGYYPFCVDETTEGSATHGWTAQINTLLAGISTMPSLSNPGDNGKVPVGYLGAYQLRAPQEFDPRSYGTLTASSSGAATVNTATFVAAIAAASAAGGGVVRPPKATYYINDRLTLPSNVALVGPAKLIMASGANEFCVTIGVGAENVRIADLEIDGNKAGNPSGASGIQSEDDTSSNVRIENVTVHDCKLFGIRVSGNDVKVTGCTAIDNGAAGITGDLLTYFVFSNNYAAGNATHGIGCIGVCSYGLVSNNTAENNGPSADNLTGYGATLKYITWANNVTRAGGNNGIHVGGDYITVIGNVIEDAADYGLIARNNDVSQMKGFTCIGNIITNSGDAAESGMWLGNLVDFVITGNMVKASIAHGILCQEGSSDGVISGNVVNDNGTSGSGDGIRIDSGCARVNVTGNTCVGNSNSDGIKVQDSTEILVQGNTCKDNARPLTVTGTSSDIKVVANDFIGNTSDTPVIVAGTVNYWSSSHNAGTVDVASASTITLPAYTDYIRITGSTDISSITASWISRRVTLRFDSANLLFADGSNLKLKGSLRSAVDDTITLVCDGTNWVEASRAVENTTPHTDNTATSAGGTRAATVALPYSGYKHLIKFIIECKEQTDNISYTHIAYVTAWHDGSAAQILGSPSIVIDQANNSSGASAAVEFTVAYTESTTNVVATVTNNSDHTADVNIYPFFENYWTASP